MTLDRQKGKDFYRLSRTDLSMHDKLHRLRFKIENRLEWITNQINYRKTSPYFEEYAQKLKKFHDQCMESVFLLQSVDNYFNYNKTVGKVQKSSTYDQVYSWVSKWPDRKQHIKELFDIDIPNDFDKPSQFQWFLDTIAKSAFDSSVSRLQNRLYCQFTESNALGWAMVFGTLTVDPEHYDKVFSKGSKAWFYFHRDFKRKLGTQLYGSIQNAKDQDYFHYFAVVEEGSNNGRLHIHCILFMREPLYCRDPNAGLAKPILREINEYHQLWPYGISQFIPIRFGVGDWWGRHGWVWPLQPDLSPIDKTDINKITQYIIKYVTKSKNIGESTWRTRTDRQMGKTTIQNIVNKTSLRDLLYLSTIKSTPIPIKIRDQKIPWKLIRHRIINRIMRNQETRRSIQLLPKNTTLKQLLNSGKKNIPDYNRKNSGSLMIQLLSNEVISENAIEPFMRIKERIEKSYN